MSGTWSSPEAARASLLLVYATHSAPASRPGRGLTARAWRTSVPPFATDDAVRVALAEADIIIGCLITAGGKPPLGENLYAAGVAQADRDAEDRLTARLKDGVQRAAFRELFSIPDQELEQTLADAYSLLTPGRNAFMGRRRALFAEQ